MNANKSTLRTDVPCLSITKLMAGDLIIMKGTISYVGITYLVQPHGPLNFNLRFDYLSTNPILIISFTPNPFLNEIETKIDLKRVKSNLGKGEFLMFLCPKTGRSCRNLYLDVKEFTWSSFLGYCKKLYYPTQLGEKWNRYEKSYKSVSEQIKRLEGTISNKLTYRGNKTKTQVKLEKLFKKKTLLDVYRNSPMAFPKKVRKLFPKDLENTVQDFLNNFG